MRNFEEEARKIAESNGIIEKRLINLLALAYGQGYVDCLQEMTEEDKERYNA